MAIKRAVEEQQTIAHPLDTGLCGIYGQHWGGPEGDAFGRAARRFEELGVGALLINCIPPDHVEGMVSYLRDFTDLPLGVYPNLGYYTDHGWRFEPGVGGDEYAAMALRWRDEGAQIIGGCCGTSPAHIAAARTRLEGTMVGRARPEPHTSTSALWAPAPPWADEQGRSVYPLVLPELTFDPDVFVPTLGSMLVWKHLFATGAGEGKRCLDVGCGSGLLAVQLALNGAEQVHGIDITAVQSRTRFLQKRSNGVADRVTGAEVDLTVEPERRYALSS
jgi:SAM-dependent methyltransferase